MQHSLLWLLTVALGGGMSATLPASAWAASPPPKQTFMVPMRDGVHLATDVRLPAGDGPWPVALYRTPYDKKLFTSNDLWLVGQFAQNGIALAVQDVRGRHASEGTAIPYVDDGWGARQDGFDSVAWIRQQPWCNGRVATFGASTPATYQLELAGAAPEGLVGQIVTAGNCNVYDEWFQSGVWLKDGNEGWLKSFKWSSESLPLFKQHPRYDDFWATMDLRNRPERVRWPIVLIGGWFDSNFYQGILDAFTLLQDHGVGGAGSVHLVIGPWVHDTTYSEVPGFDGRAGELRFPSNAAYPHDAPTQMQWLRSWLTGQPAIATTEPPVRYYVMGDVKDPKAPGNVWRTADRWPPASQPLRLYFTADGGLDSQPPAAETTQQYDYDPLHPVPSLFGDRGGPADQRRVENRPDVLLFTTPPLSEPLEVTGKITVHLSAATSAQDTDFTARLTDVYQDGRSMLLCNGVGIVRGSYRSSVEKAEFLTPRQRYAFEINVGTTSLIFNKGHRLRVAISSSSYPMFDPNRNNGYSWPEDQEHPSVVAHQTIFLGGTDGSAIVLPQVVGAGP